MKTTEEQHTMLKIEPAGVNFRNSYNRDTMAKALEMERESFDNMIKGYVWNEEGLTKNFTSERVKLIYGIFRHLYNPFRCCTTNISLKEYSKVKLAMLLDMNTHRLKRMVQPHIDDVGKAMDERYNLRQVLVILGIYYNSQEQRIAA